MALYLPHIKSSVEKTLTEFDEAMLSKSAVNLVLGTFAQESLFGTYIYQLGGGPGLGFGQMERPTFNWLKNFYQRKYPVLVNVKFEDLENNIYWMIVFTRLRYRVVPEPLPYQNDVEALATYWKKYYNTYLGKGKISEFVANYKKYVAADMS